MVNDFVIMGIGELGALYGAGALRTGYRVTPIRRMDRPSERLEATPTATPVLVAVGERDLQAALERLPDPRRQDAILIQNELFPQTWQDAGLRDPTVVVPWVLKKPGLPVTVARPTPVYGRHADAMVAIHEALALPCEPLADAAALGQALVSKYAFILTINVLGLKRDITLGEWLETTDGAREALVREAIALGRAKLDAPVDTERVEHEIQQGMRALASFPAKGRTAQPRLLRALEDAHALGLALPTLHTLS